MAANAGVPPIQPRLRVCPPLLFLLLLFRSSLALPTSSQLEPQGYSPLKFVHSHCRFDSNFLSPTFSENLDTALRNLTALASQGASNATTTAGTSGQDMVYAAFQCRGDLSTQSCSLCMQNLIAHLQEKGRADCVERSMQLEGCFLRYDNHSFFVLDTTFKYSSGRIEAERDPVLRTAVEYLMALVTSQAPKRGGFASANASGVYAMAQCMGYLDESECSQCIDYLDQFIYRNCTGCGSPFLESSGRNFLSGNFRRYNPLSGSMRLQVRSCYLRNEMYNFLEEAPPEGAGYAITNYNVQPV